MAGMEGVIISVVAITIVILILIFVIWLSNKQNIEKTEKEKVIEKRDQKIKLYKWLETIDDKSIITKEKFFSMMKGTSMWNTIFHCEKLWSYEKEVTWKQLKNYLNIEKTLEIHEILNVLESK